MRVSSSISASSLSSWKSALNKHNNIRQLQQNGHQFTVEAEKRSKSTTNLQNAESSRTQDDSKKWQHSNDQQSSFNNQQNPFVTLRQQQTRLSNFGDRVFQNSHKNWHLAPTKNITSDLKWLSSSSLAAAANDSLYYPVLVEQAGSNYMQF